MVGRAVLTCLCLATASAVSVNRVPKYNQALNVLERKSTSAGGTVQYLGTFDDIGLCEEACLDTGADSPDRCNYYIFFPADQGSVRYASQCYSVTSPGWNPSYDETAVTGAVAWPCQTDSDCSLNGVCNAGSCDCRTAWSGDRCETLNIMPTTHHSGYRGTDGGHNTSSWGGAVLEGADGKYHMWASEMTEHCGIGAWAQNSRIIHAVSDTPGGNYTRQEVVYEVFSHEPEVVPGPNGEYVMYFTAQLRSEHGDCDCCRLDDGGLCDGSTGPGDCPYSTASRVPYGRRDYEHPILGDSDPSLMSWATSPEGPWSEPLELFKDYEGSDTNFAPLILANGSMIALWREWNGVAGSQVFLATGSDWKDPDTYVQHVDRMLFPDLGPAGTEDPFMYLDDNGNYHAVFHHMYGTGTLDQWWLDATGGHAFSIDGWDWTYTGVAWGDAMSRYNTQDGQGAVVEFDGGDTFTFTRLERPHLLFASSKSGQLQGDPTHLICAAQYGNGTDPGTGALNDDATYTIVIPVKTE